MPKTDRHETDRKTMSKDDVEISSEFEVLGPRNGRGPTSSKPPQSYKLKPKSKGTAMPKRNTSQKENPRTVTLTPD